MECRMKFSIEGKIETDIKRKRKVLLLTDEEGARSSYHGAPVVTSAMRVC